MKIKFLAVLGLAAVAGLSGCKSAANTNVANMTSNASNAAVNTMTAPTPMTSAPAMDTATQTTVNSALTKAGITGVTVEATSAAVTLRGSVAKGKMAEAVRVAQEAGKKPVKNELTEMAK